MRVLRTVLWLVPALAKAASIPPSIHNPSSAALITLDIPELGSSLASKELSFRFDVLESKDACGFANVTIDGRPLPADGHGSLSTSQGPVLDASWSFTCVVSNAKATEQSMKLNVESIDNVKVQNVALSIQFHQVPPLRVAVMDSAASLSRVSYPASLDSSSEVNDSDLKTEVADLEGLRQQLSDLEQAILTKEAFLAKRYGWSTSSVRNCEGLKCTIQSLLEHVKGAAKTLYDQVASGQHRHHAHPGLPQCHCPPMHHPPMHHPPPHKKPHRKPHHPPPPPEPPLPIHHPIDEPERPFTPDVPFEPDVQFPPDRPFAVDAPPPPPPPPPPPHHHRPPPPRHARFLFHTLKIVGLAILVASFVIIIHKCCCKRRRSSCKERRARRREWRQKWEARREHRRAAIKGFFAQIFSRSSCQDEEKAVTIRQPPESGDESDISTTMEQEIAQFRAAANVVGDMVTAEESRARAAEPHPATPPSPGAFAEYMPDFDVPPAYEERRRSLSADESIVTDGFRYTPGSHVSQYTPSSTAVSVSGGSSDVLGYAKPVAERSSSEEQLSC